MLVKKNITICDLTIVFPSFACLKGHTGIHIHIHSVRQSLKKFSSEEILLVRVREPFLNTLLRLLVLEMPMLVEDSPKGGNDTNEHGEEGFNESDSGSEGGMPDFGENICPACMQQFGNQDEDCPFSHWVLRVICCT